MSYEFLLFVPGPWGDPLEEGRKRYAGSSNPLENEKASSENYKQNMQGSILTLQPEYEALDTDFESIAHEEGISLAKARQLYRDIEISPPETDKGPHITLQDDQVIFTLPVPDEPDDAREVFDITWQLMQACEKVQAGHVYLPQVDTMIRLRDTHDRELAWTHYHALVEALKKPWWKFW